ELGQGGDGQRFARDVRAETGGVDVECGDTNAVHGDAVADPHVAEIQSVAGNADAFVAALVTDGADAAGGLDDAGEHGLVVSVGTVNPPGKPEGSEFYNLFRALPHRRR